MEHTILVVGGSPPTHEQLANALSGDGFAVQSAGDGVAGLYQLVASQPELVIVDLEDWETVKRMRRVSSVPIIALAPDDGASGLKSLASGADYYVLKPPAMGELRAKVRASLRR
ncbi:MAG: response regulator transcription factor, partial [Anaerolineae bacterium]|nr:response regulator transcription factor [Anaerolineae bacterium]